MAVISVHGKHKVHVRNIETASTYLIKKPSANPQRLCTTTCLLRTTSIVRWFWYDLAQPRGHHSLHVEIIVHRLQRCSSLGLSAALVETALKLPDTLAGVELYVAEQQDTHRLLHSLLSPVFTRGFRTWRFLLRTELSYEQLTSRRCKNVDLRAASTRPGPRNVSRNRSRCFSEII